MSYFNKFQHFKSNQLFEKSLAEAEEELKRFQKEVNIDETLSRALKAIKAKKLNIKSIFGIDDLDFDNLLHNKEFQQKLKTMNLTLSTLQNSDDSSTLLRNPVKWYWIEYITKNSDNSDDMVNQPLYILLQAWDELENSWDKPQLYYVQDNVEYFDNAITSVSLEINMGDKKWIYKTSNSGRDWNLKSGNPTGTFTKVLDWEDLNVLKNEDDIKIKFY